MTFKLKTVGEGYITIGSHFSHYKIRYHILNSMKVLSTVASVEKCSYAVFLHSTCYA